MSPHVRLALVLHNHQPIGNFEDVCEAAWRDSYVPFLDVLEQFPDLPISLHTSGSLLEWLETAHPEYLDRVKTLVARGQIEILGGAYYEPILACIPRADRVGQVRKYRQHLETLFETPVRGMWVPERVWEQQFASDLCRSGMEYTVLDDYHFLQSGMSAEELHGYFLTEDEGRLFKIFPISERLRYTIPFQDVSASIQYLREIAERQPGAVVTFGDDGEKFGVWPRTKELVFERGWLKQFFAELMANREWLEVVKLGQVVDSVPPQGTCYLPDCSYREMTEWVLPTEKQQELRQLRQEKEHHDDSHWQRTQPWMRGGYWRNFRTKYSESQEMYSRMLQISRRLQQLEETTQESEERDWLEQARTSLYRAQCNCTYWHGAFGGLYLPHLRNAVYHHLIQAENILESVGEPEQSRWVRVETNDYNLDARKEVKLSSDRLAAFFAPANGGHLYELDIRQIHHNLLATLNRRPEPYHDLIRDQVQNGVETAEDFGRCKEPELDRKLQYDLWPRKALVDHFLQPSLTLDEFRNHNTGQVGDFVTGTYSASISNDGHQVQLQMQRQGQLGNYTIRVEKSVTLSTTSSNVLQVHYRLDDLPPGVLLHFGVEFNFAGLAAGAPDRYYYDTLGQQYGQLETVQELRHQNRLGLADEWLGLNATLELSREADFWMFPIETISQSESGYEAVHQSCAVIPRWYITADESGHWEVSLALTLDTSIAQARVLAERAATKTVNEKLPVPEGI